MGQGGNNLAQPRVMAPTTQPQILPKEGDSFFSSLWNWFKWPFKTDLVSLAYWRAAMQTVISLFIWAVSFPSFSSLSLFLLLPPPSYYFFFTPKSLQEETPPRYLQENTFLFRIRENTISAFEMRGFSVKAVQVVTWPLGAPQARRGLTHAYCEFLKQIFKKSCHHVHPKNQNTHTISSCVDLGLCMYTECIGVCDQELKDLFA